MTTEATENAHTPAYGAAGLAGRGCSFSRLRLAGTSLSVLQRAVALESAVSLLVTAVVAIGTAASAMFTTAQLRYPLVNPGLVYYVITVAGIACLARHHRRGDAAAAPHHRPGWPVTSG